MMLFHKNAQTHDQKEWASPGSPFRLAFCCDIPYARLLMIRDHEEKLSEQVLGDTRPINGQRVAFSGGWFTP